MKLINSLSILPLILTLSIVRADYTADVMFTDSEYNEIGPEYPAGTETLYFEVYDPDVAGSLDVTLTSDTDTEGETVTLNEVDGEAGYFRGSIAVEVASSRLIDEDLLLDRIDELRSEYPNRSDEDLGSLARGQLMEEAINNLPVNTSTREQDGILQAQSGDIVTLTYEDALNDYGEPVTIIDQKIYGGWSGAVSGIWTADISPYVITGEIVVNGKSYNSYMAYQGLDNDEIADIMNYILNEWGNNSEEFVTFERVDKIEKSILK